MAGETPPSTPSPEPEIPTEVEILPPERLEDLMQAPAVRPRLLPQVAELLKDPELGRQHLERMRDLIKDLRTFSIHLTHPTDWILHVTRDPSDESKFHVAGYLRDWGAQRIAPFWGISIVPGTLRTRRANVEGAPGEPATYILYAKADFVCQRTGLYFRDIEGGRWSGDEFFQRQVEKKGFVNPLHVEKAGLANMHGTAVRQITGLTGIPDDVLKAAGLNIADCVVVGYRGAARARRGEAAPEGEGTRGPTVRQELAQLIAQKAKAAGKNTVTFLRELCKQHGLPEKDTVPELTESQVADLVVVLREAK